MQAGRGCARAAPGAADPRRGGDLRPRSWKLRSAAERRAEACAGGEDDHRADHAHAAAHARGGLVAARGRRADRQPLARRPHRVRVVGPGRPAPHAAAPRVGLVDELLASLPADALTPRRAWSLELGCGPGTVAAGTRARWPVRPARLGRRPDPQRARRCAAHAIVHDAPGPAARRWPTRASTSSGRRVALPPATAAGPHAARPRPTAFCARRACSPPSSPARACGPGRTTAQPWDERADRPARPPPATGRRRARRSRRASPRRWWLHEHWGRGFDAVTLPARAGVADGPSRRGYGLGVWRRREVACCPRHACGASRRRPAQRPGRRATSARSLRAEQQDLALQTVRAHDAALERARVLDDPASVEATRGARAAHRGQRARRGARASGPEPPAADRPSPRAVNRRASSGQAGGRALRWRPSSRTS